MKPSLETDELVTVQAKVTVSDGLQGLEWLSIFKDASLQTTVTNRHSRLEPSLEPSLIPEKEEKTREFAAHSPSFRRVNARIYFPAKIETAPGAAKIASTFQSFRLLFEAARRGDLPTAPLDVEIAGEIHTLENAAAAVLALEIEWTKTARQCQREKRDLTEIEVVALDAAAELFNHVWACFDGPGAAWLDLVALNAQLDAEIKAMHQKQRAAKSAAKESEPQPRRAAVLRGETVVANKNSDADLIEWAQSQGLAVGIMRQNQWKNAKWASEWANPFRMKKSLEGSDRDEVCDRHAEHLAESPDFLARIGELRGKVLVCCCHPARCHGDELARRANEIPSEANQ